VEPVVMSIFFFVDLALFSIPNIILMTQFEFSRSDTSKMLRLVRLDPRHPIYMFTTAPTTLITVLGYAHAHTKIVNFSN
jgi:hypothetical protein